MHYTTSHIEHTSQDVKRTGNFYADRLATFGRLQFEISDQSRYQHMVRNKVLTATTYLIDEIETILNKERRYLAYPMARLPQEMT